MLIWVIAVGTVVLVGLAVAVGHIDGGAQKRAWRRIARGRRDLAEQHRLLDDQAAALVERERELWDWEAQLTAVGNSQGCPVCELRRRRGERPVS